MKACGLKVLLEKIDTSQEKIIGGIVIPFQMNKMTRTAKAKVLSIGEEARSKDLGLEIGDIVIYDFYSVYYDHPEPEVVTNIENIVAKTSLNDSDMFVPLGNRLLTVKMEKMNAEMRGGIAIPVSARTDEKWLRVVGFGIKYDGPFKKNDLLKIDPSAKDFMFLRHEDTTYAIVHTEDIICMMED